MAGTVIFMIGIILIALNFTYFPLDALLLAGIILAGLGVAFSKLFREF
jgi:hypothetical protein